MRIHISMPLTYINVCGVRAPEPQPSTEFPQLGTHFLISPMSTFNLLSSPPLPISGRDAGAPVSSVNCLTAVGRSARDGSRLAGRVDAKDILASSSVGTSGTLSTEVVDMARADLYFGNGCELKKVAKLNVWNKEVNDNSATSSSLIIIISSDVRGSYLISAVPGPDN